MNLVGARVLRGPDWDYCDLDGGDGHIGTIVDVNRRFNTAKVLWDNGQLTLCKSEKNGQHDLRIFDSGPVGVWHMDYVCSSCNANGIFGMRWQCKQCSNVNLCPACYGSDEHDLDHLFLRFDTSQSESGVRIPKRYASIRCQAMGIFPGAIVKRGRDWIWNNQDGGDDTSGEVVSISDCSAVRNMIEVKWKSSGETKSYRLGIEGKVDLMFVEQSRGPFYYRDHLPLCEMELYVNRGESVCGAEVESKLKVGDTVCINVSLKNLEKCQEYCGRSMLELIGKDGEIKEIGKGGEVFVEFDGLESISPQFLTKVYEFNKGDIVRILNDEEKVKELQGEHGYNKEMKHYLGKVCRVINVSSYGDLHVKFGLKELEYNRMCCLPAPGENVYDECDEDVNLSEIECCDGDETHMGLAEMLVTALFQDDISVMHCLLNTNPELVNIQYCGKTLLFEASHKGHRKSVVELLNSGADIDEADDDGITPLIASIIGKDPTIGEILIERGADVNITKHDGRNALHVAAFAHCGSLVEMIIRNGCNINVQDFDGNTALHDAIRRESNDSVAALCNETDLNPGIVNGAGFNALQLASSLNQTFAVDKILDRHESLVNVQMLDGFTPLHIAADNNFVACAKLLIEKGNAEINIGNLKGRTPLWLAAKKGLECVQLLCEKSADVNVVDGSRNGPLHACCYGDGSSFNINHASEQRIRVARCLIQNGARTDQQNMRGATPLECCMDKNMKRNLSEFCRQSVARKRSTDSINDGPPAKRLKSTSNPSSPTFISDDDDLFHGGINDQTIQTDTETQTDTCTSTKQELSLDVLQAINQAVTDAVQSIVPDITANVLDSLRLESRQLTGFSDANQSTDEDSGRENFESLENYEPCLPD